MEPSLRRTRRLQIFDLVAVRGGFQRSFETLAVGWFDPIDQAMTDQFVFAIARFEAAAVGVADQAGGVEHQDHALRGIQDLLVEVALALELRLEHFLLGDVEHQAANLGDLSGGVANRSNVLQGVQQGAVLAAQRLFVVAQNAALRQGAQEAFAGGGHGIEVRADVGAEQLVARGVAEHAHHRVVDVEKASVGCGEEQAFLNAVEELAIAALGFAAVGHVLQNVDRAGVVVGEARGSGSGDQENALGRRDDVLFARLLGVAAERAGQVGAGFGDLAEAAHGFADQSDRGHAQDERPKSDWCGRCAKTRSWTTM